MAVTKSFEKSLDDMIDSGIDLEEIRRDISGSLSNYSQALRNFRNSGKIELLMEGGGAGIGLAKGTIDGSIISKVLDLGDNEYNIVKLPFDYTHINIVELPRFFGGSSPLIPPSERESWEILVKSLGLKAKYLAPIAGFAIGLAAGSVASSLYGWISDNKSIFKPLEQIVGNIENISEDILGYEQLKNASKEIKSHIRGIYNRIKGFYRKLKTLGRAIKSVGTTFFAYLAFRFIYSVVSLLLGLGDIPSVINTVEDANFYAQMVYDTIMMAKEMMPVAEQYAKIVLVGSLGSYGVGKGIEWYADKKIIQGISDISDNIEELANLYAGRVASIRPSTPIVH